MSLCPICGKYEYSTAKPSCDCYKRFQEDVKQGNYPPGLSEEARKYFMYTHWYSLHEIEAKVRQLRMTPNEANVAMARIVASLNALPQQKRQYETALQRVRGWELY